jgi:hypothetical protein
MGRPKKTQDTVKRPSVDWEGNDNVFTWKLIELLKEHTTIRRGLWPGKSEKTVTKSKATLQRYLSNKLLKDHPTYSTHVKAAPAMLVRFMQLRPSNFLH